MLYATNPYSDSSGYLQMALGAYLTPSGGGYKSVDPYFLSQGKFETNHFSHMTYTLTSTGVLVKR